MMISYGAIGLPTPYWTSHICTTENEFGITVTERIISAEEAFAQPRYLENSETDPRDLTSTYQHLFEP